MPRNRQYQAPQAQNSQAYGEKTQQLQAQQQMPLPQTDPGMPQPQQSGPAGVTPDLIQQAQAFDPGITPLTAPSQRPGEPVTAGLTTGAGPGPEIFSSPARATRAADALTMLAQASGNDGFAQQAARIRQAGGGR